MISVTRLNGDAVVVNAGLIEFIESTPDTLLSLATGHKMMIRESIDDVITLAIAYYQRIGCPPFAPPGYLAHEAAKVAEAEAEAE
ncbi:MAG TPA: flagellar FlbD family protein [Armatimonadota bacterium]